MRIAWFIVALALSSCSGSSCAPVPAQDAGAPPALSEASARPISGDVVLDFCSNLRTLRCSEGFGNADADARGSCEVVLDHELSAHFIGRDALACASKAPTVAELRACSRQFFKDYCLDAGAQ